MTSVRPLFPDDPALELDALRGHVGALFDVADPSTDPEGLITKFVAYEGFRFRRPHHELDIAGTLQDRLSVLFWYLIDYAHHRGNAYVMPLSAQQIAFLNSPAPIAGASSAVTVALFNFVVRERRDCLDLMDPAILKRALYWWCIERAPRGKFTDQLVTEEQIALLRTEDQWLDEPFPLNPYMTMVYASRPDLHELQLHAARDRGAFLHFLVLQGFTDPYLLRFLPRDVLRASLHETLDGASLFDRVLAKLAFPGGAPIEEGQKLHAIGTQLVEHAGLNLERIHKQRPSGDSGQCFVHKRPFQGKIEDGVSVIGPIGKASGLGQATRLSYDVLAGIEDLEPTAIDFDLDNPAPTGFSTPGCSKPLDERRAINLVHLNAESIPLAFAYEQREIFASSYNIGYFFWELNVIPKCHLLALELLDEIWVSSEYNRDIYARYTKKPVINVGMPVEKLPTVQPFGRSRLGIAADSFVFLSTFDSFSFIERKNPLAVLDAFRAAFPLGSENVNLVLKTQNRSRVSDPYQLALWKRIDQAIYGDPRIILINETFKYADLLGLKMACDCYVSLHRSEGWGFGMIEAMQLGKPVITTAYSGNLEFCNSETAYLVDHDLISVREEEYIFVERGSLWAQPRLSTAVAHMRAVVADPNAAGAKGQVASRYVASNFSLDIIGQRYAKRLRQIRAMQRRTRNGTSPAYAI